MGGGVHVRLVAGFAEVEAVEEGAHVGVNPTWRDRPHRSAAPRHTNGRPGPPPRSRPPVAACIRPGRIGLPPGCARRRPSAAPGMEKSGVVRRPRCRAGRACRSLHARRAPARCRCTCRTSRPRAADAVTATAGPGLGIRCLAWPRARVSSGSRSCSTSTASTCACRARSGSTSRRAARPSSTWSTTTSRSATASSTRCASGRACCTASPTGSAGPKVHQKRLPARRAAVGRDGAAALPPLRPARRRAVRHPAGRRGLGGADEHRRVPPVEQPPRRHREARRVAHRPRPDAGRALLARCAGPRTSPTRCSTSSAPSAGRRRAAATGCTSTCGSRPTTGSATCAGPRWPSPARWSAASPTT